MMRFPEAYTYEEAGFWQPWKPEWGGIDSKYLDAVKLPERGRGFPSAVEIPLVADKKFCLVHALRFEGGQEWDCINGWRK